MCNNFYDQKVNKELPSIKEYIESKEHGVHKADLTNVRNVCYLNGLTTGNCLEISIIYTYGIFFINLLIVYQCFKKIWDEIYKNAIQLSYLDMVTVISRINKWCKHGIRSMK